MFDFKELEIQFLNAADRLDHEHCQKIIRQLNVTGKQYIYKTYFQGIYEFTFNDDSHKAEHLFQCLFELSPTLSMQAKLYRAIGRCKDFQGRFESAITAYKQSLDITETLNDTFGQSKNLQNMAGTCNEGFFQGQFDLTKLQEGIVYCQKALKLVPNGPQERTQMLLGHIWIILGELNMSASQWDSSVECLEKSLQIYQLLNNERYAGYAHGNLGEVHVRQYLEDMTNLEYLDKALASFQKALYLLRKSKDGYEEAEALANLSYFYQVQTEYKQALLHYKHAIELIENNREQISSPEARAEFFTTMVDTYANTILTCISMNDPAQAFHYAERARARTYLDLLNPPSQESESTTIANLPIMTVEQIQQRLSNDEILLVYFTTGSIEATDRNARGKQKPKRYRFPEEKTMVFLLTNDAFELIDVNISPNRLRLDSSIDYYAKEQQQGFLSKFIYSKLVAPIASSLAGKKRLFISLHDFLNDIPFHMVVHGHKQKLPNNPPLIFSPSATFLCTPTTSSLDREKQPNKPSLIISYNGGHDGLEQLHYTEAHAELMAQAMNGTALIGEVEKKPFLFEHSSAYRILHFACHGEHNEHQPLQSKLYIGPDEVLTVKEVQDQLTLTNAIVIIGACESGVAQVRRGNELMGFVRAFIQAGARAVIATQWKVSELATRILLEKFYEEVMANQNIGTALHNAQCYLRSLSKADVIQHLYDFYQGKLDEVGKQMLDTLETLSEHPLDDPIHWATFVLVANLDAVQERGILPSSISLSISQ
ncbi:MAG: CHAT domain-containing protein [Chloroflexota bacterium]